MKKIIILAAVMAATVSLSGCTTCDLARWLGDDICAIGV